MNSRFLGIGLALLVIPLSHASVQAQQGVEFFEKKIRPILAQHCYQCHSVDAKKLRGDLLLDTRVGMHNGGETGAAVVPGKPEESLLISALRHEDYEMPPNGKLPKAVIANFVKWIEMGAPDPRVSDQPGVVKKRIDIEEGRKFWAFQPIKDSLSPRTKDSSWSRSAIDRFVLAKLERQGLKPVADADRLTLIRRVYFDLVGLPPGPKEVDAFLNDSSGNALETVIDRLLDSPHFGERWGRHWLDIAHYAESNGNVRNVTFPHAWRYRDWVIQAFNDDLPYDQFVTHQLAGDLVAAETAEQRNSQKIATGFSVLMSKPQNGRTLRMDLVAEQVEVATRAFMGLTVACARCHDHKFDPIPTKDYYALAGVFASTKMYNRPIDDSCETDKDGQAKSPEHAIHIVQDGKPTDLNVFVRGDVNSKGPLVKRRFLQVLCRDEPEVFSQGSGRLELAAAIADRDNPLTARVVVNRIWALCFGQPLVGTPSNFGSLGELPTHPRLLDDLAVRFMDGGWSIKRLLRDIVLSATYRQSAKFDPDKYAADPSNRLYWRMNRRRLEVESWRDSVLAVSGRLDLSVGGPSVEPQNPEVRKLSNDFRNQECIACHAPRPVLAFEPGERVLARQGERGLGVDCLSCHAHPEGGVATSNPAAKMDAPCRPRLVERMSSVEHCAACNNQHQTVEQWRAAPPELKGDNCLDCHM
ncbi:MAG: PSD1 domain-containing protein, partial [Planctomycetes bacterium]|nr:PSD1 domain-containing protein [Planctomycetota bacterium]